MVQKKNRTQGKHKIEIRLSQLAPIVSDLKKNNKKIGLITGCFDIIHSGHIRLFRFAKKYVDVLIVGLENDHAIKLYKGSSRPINSLKSRSLVLSELSSIDYIFPIEKHIHNTDENYELYKKITKKINPDYLITNKSTDRFWTEKQTRAKKLSIKFVSLKTSSPISSSHIIEKLTD